MTDQLRKITLLFTKINNFHSFKIIEKKDIEEISEEIENIKEDLFYLNKWANEVEKLSKKDLDKEIELLANIYRGLGELIQDLANIHEIISPCIKKFANHYVPDDENNNE